MSEAEQVEHLSLAAIEGRAASLLLQDPARVRRILDTLKSHGHQAAKQAIRCDCALCVDLPESKRPIRGWAVSVGDDR